MDVEAVERVKESPRLSSFYEISPLSLSQAHNRLLRALAQESSITGGRDSSVSEVQTDDEVDHTSDISETGLSLDSRTSYDILKRVELCENKSQQ